MSSYFSLLSLIVIIPFLGMLFVFTSRNDESGRSRNALNVCTFTILANILLIWRIFMLLNEKSRDLQLVEKFNWLTSPNINIEFAVD